MSIVLDLFAGPGGWSLACHRLGFHDLGIEWDPWTCATRRAAGLTTIESDVAAMDPADYRDIAGLIASPPCQPFSAAGKRRGLADPRGRLVYQPMRFARHIHPPWIAMEEVPTVLPLWETFAGSLRRDGYATWTGILSAEEYGVPQTRRRAFLLASRMRDHIHPPKPTHTRYVPGHPRHAPPLQPWVSMADVLGRGMLDRPAFTVTTRGNSWGGSSTRRALQQAQQKGRWAGLDGRLTAAEFGVLQSFPAGFPWQGTHTRQLVQVGNAVPPALAVAVLSAVARDQPRQQAA
ncbi:DNA cytosine methyltransferase [Frankia sp. Cr1]|uniref:DNA cytosine methyltransferase n=1 Tax=Frankia sp. Cr1 TaxID=3073931 RepID=UPI002AD23E3A|nr:DNA cytosine methyltransferase [Frankia sp. Cr1]